MITQIDIIFRGSKELLDIDFISTLLNQSSDSWFNSPEVEVPSSHDEFNRIITQSDYVDFVISSDKVKIADTEIANVFINLGVDDNQVELLFSFDIKQIGPDYKITLGYLKKWSYGFKEQYHFAYVRCQIDNGNEDEFFFDSDGNGPLWSKLGV